MILFIEIAIFVHHSRWKFQLKLIEQRSECHRQGPEAGAIEAVSGFWFVAYTAWLQHCHHWRPFPHPNTLRLLAVAQQTIKNINYFCIRKLSTAMAINWQIIGRRA